MLAIGNPLAYEHTVTVGVVSFIGRKLFDSSLDRYIQTDAAINFGNSGGPLINARGEVIGINAAISSRAANIGFAVPINQARTSCRSSARVAASSRGYIGVTLRDVDPDLQQSLGLGLGRMGRSCRTSSPGSPGARAGLRTYDVIVAVDGQPVEGNDALIQMIAAREPGIGRDATGAARRPVDERHAQAGRASAARSPASSRSGSAPAVDVARARQSASRSENWTTSRPRGSDCPAGTRGSSSPASSR